MDEDGHPTDRFSMSEWLIKKGIGELATASEELGFVDTRLLPHLSEHDMLAWAQACGQVCSLGATLKLLQAWRTEVSLLNT